MDVIVFSRWLLGAEFHQIKYLTVSIDKMIALIEEDLLMYFQSKSSNIENMTLRQFAQLISSIVQTGEKLPDIPLEELSGLASIKVSQEQSFEKLIYKGVPFYLSREGDFDEWSACVDWYGRLMDVDVEGMQWPTRENVMVSVHRLINILTDIRDRGVIYPDSYFIEK